MAARKKATSKPLYTEKGPSAAMTNEPVRKDWRDPDVTFSPDDESLEARMWRLGQRQANVTK